MLGYRSLRRNRGAEVICSGREGKEGGSAAVAVEGWTDERDKKRRWNWGNCLRLRMYDCGRLCCCGYVRDGVGDMDEGGIEY